MSPFICFFVLLSFPISFGKNVLIWSSPAKSHRLSMYPMAGALAARGHKVVLLSETFAPEKAAPPPGVEEKLVELRNKSYHIWGPFHYSNTTFHDQMWTLKPDAFVFETPWKFTCRTCQDWLTNQRQDYDSIVNVKWDLVLVDSLFAPCGLAHTKLNLQVPFGLIHPTFLESLVSDQQALSWSVGTIAPEFPRVTFKASELRSRLDSVINYILFHYVYRAKINYLVTEALKATVGQVFLHDFYRDSVGSFVSYPSLVDSTYPIGSDVVNFGSACEFLPAKPLPKDLENFVSDHESKGTILLAFGTLVAWETAPKEIIDAVLTVLKGLSDYRIIWRYTGPKKDFPRHIWVTKWAPQNDILMHPRTKAFWSHGGIKSLKETICAGVPAVYMPIFAEQIRNAMSAVAHGFGKMVDKATVNDSKMVTATIRKVLETPEYKAKAVRMRQLFGDHLVRPTSKSVWFAELLMKHRGMPAQFQRRGKRLNWIQFLNLDVLAVFSLFLYVCLSCFRRGVAAGFRHLAKNTGAEK